MKKQKKTSKPKVKEPVTLRQKPLKNGGFSLYLDCYVNGNRWYEFLKLYLVPNNTPNSKQRNDETLSLAASIQGKRIAELQNDAHGFSNSKLRSKTSLIAYIEADVKKRQERAIAAGRKKMSGTSTLSCLIYHLKQYKGDKITFQQVDKNFCLGFMDYLRSSKSTTHSDKLLSLNTQVDYVTKLITTLNNAIKDDIIQTNPMVLIKREDKPKGYIPEIEYLTNKEINMLANTEFEEMPMLKRAFLFSCYTGLRFSDVENLTWEKLRKSDSGKTLLKFVQRKTNKPEYPPISDKAVRWLPERGFAKDNDRIFQMPPNGYANKLLREWAKSAGITKKISYHVSRHTTATLLLSSGVPLTTVQKIMGHSDIRTTLRYAKVIDKNVSDAVEILDNLPDAA